MRTLLFIMALLGFLQTINLLTAYMDSERGVMDYSDVTLRSK